MPDSPIHDVHSGLGARFTDFGGWTMPVQYGSVLAEHAAVRTAAGVFDVSHLGRFAVTGSGAATLIREQFCNDITRIGVGRAQYTMALNERGGIIDDIIVWRFDEDDFWVMPNGTNFDAILDRFRAGAGTGVTVDPVRDATVLLAVQGPDSPEVVDQVLGSMPRRFRVETGVFGGAWYRAAGTGYTGERGAEIAVPAANGAKLFEALVEAGATPAALGARDTLRLEMGYPLWGQDLDKDTTPLEAGLGWVVAWGHEFTGRAALVRQREAGVPRSLVAFQTEGRAIPRHGHRLRSGRSDGVVTSGNFSPSLRHGIGLGYLEPPPEEGTDVQVEIRGRWVEAERVDLPFLDR